MSEKECKEGMYEDTCKDRFDAIDAGNLEIKGLIGDFRAEIKELAADLKHVHNRLFVSNGKRAVVELIRDNKNEIARHVASDTEHKLREECVNPFPTKEEIKGPRKIKILSGLFSAENYTPIDILKIGLAVVGCVLLFGVLMKLLHLQSIINV